MNYAKITKGFMHLLKQDTPFVWDETTQLAFEAFKKALLSAPLLRPPDYSRDFILYLDASESTIGVVLVQEDDNIKENVVYYLSRALAGPELRYSHVEKLTIRGNLGSKMGLIKKRAKISFCELEFKNQ